ncbi:MAG: oxidoreductase [Candidatus Binatia bacterium]|nr:MAG: oxidoreductase [Candidatus Binatia bacterium]
MELGLRDKVVLVTGAASGMGRATALLFAEEGARVMVADVQERGARETAEEIRNRGGDADFVVGDVSVRKDAVGYVEATVRRFGRLHVLVNNAGVEAFADLVHTSDEAWEKMFGVNAKGPYMVMQAGIPHIAEAGGGAIVNVASGAGLRGNVGLVAYSAAKAALLLMTRCVAREVGNLNIRANAIAPGLFDTPTGRRWIDLVGGMDKALELVGGGMAIRRAGRPEEVARAVVFLASEAASYITGVVLPVDGGMSA